MSSAVDSLCPYCGVVCQVRYHLGSRRIRWAEGIDRPANRGRLCVKGRFGWDYASHPERLTSPLVRREDAAKTPNPDNPMAQFREASWEDALKRAADGFMKIKQRYGVGALGGFGTAKGSNEEGYLFPEARAHWLRHQFGGSLRAALPFKLSGRVDRSDWVPGAATAAYTQIENADVALVSASIQAGASPSPPPSSNAQRASRV